MRRILVRVWIGCMVGALLTRCDSNQEFTQRATTQFFLQDYNPEYIDVLWMIDDRSPLYRVREALVEQAKAFFVRLDGVAGQYRMAFVSADMEYARGALKPTENPKILIKNLGTVESRATQFAAIISQIINLRTGAINQGFESARVALTDHFAPRAGVPLVIVFISDSDDHSSLPPGVTETAVDYYAKHLLSLKQNNPELLRVYSINYVKGEGAKRCATLYNADIDSASFEDRYFLLAQKLKGDTGDLCSAFADRINLGGLRLKELPRSFLLERRARSDSIQVFVFRANERFDNLHWAFDSARNEIVFDAPPPDGATIQVTYHTD